jgi:hypothetical protein
MNNFPNFQQLTLFDQVETIPEPFTGADLRDHGIETSVQHANNVEPGWSELAYQFLLDFITDVGEFLCEDLRIAAKGKVPDPPDGRAWGYVIVKAVKAGVIRRQGYGTMKAACSHKCPKTIWISNI